MEAYYAFVEVDPKLMKVEYLLLSTFQQILSAFDKLSSPFFAKPIIIHVNQKHRSSYPINLTIIY